MTSLGHGDVILLNRVLISELSVSYSDIDSIDER